jgi:hypothetical protein
MADEATEYRVLGELRLDDETMMVFAAYSLGKRRLGSARIYREAKGYAGPTRAGFDMQLDQLKELVPVLQRLSVDLDDGTVAPPAELARIPGGRTNSWVVSLVEPDEQRTEAMVDIRKFVTSEKYTGWTKKGLRVSIDCLDDMIPHLATVQQALVDWQEGRSGLFVESDEHVKDSPDDSGGLSSVPPEYKDLF